MPPFPKSKSAVEGPVAPNSHLCREHGHAMKNIFSIIRANVEMIGEESLPGDAVQRRLLRIMAACDRGEELIETLQPPSSRDVRNILAAKRSAEEIPVGPLQGRILVVDDEPDILKIIEHYLKDQPLSLQGLTSGLAAMEHLQNIDNQYDLVLTDLEMPSCHGVELSSYLKTHRPTVPVILMTGYGQSLSENDLENASIQAVVAKPLDQRLLLATLAQFLSVS